MVAVNDRSGRVYLCDDGGLCWIVGAQYEPDAGTEDKWYQLNYAEDPDQALAEIQERLPGMMNPGLRPTPREITAWKFGPFASLREAVRVGRTLQRGFSQYPRDHPLVSQLIDAGFPVNLDRWWPEMTP